MTREQAIAYALESSGASGDPRAEQNPPAAPSRSGQTASQSLPDPLTTRELQILRMIADGLNTREIADGLVIGVGTVRWYVKQIYSKLNAHSRVEAVARARSLGLLP